MRPQIQKSIIGILLGFCFFWGIAKPCYAQSASEKETVEQYLEDAQASFDKQEFSASFELYQRILVLDPSNQIAREKISELAEMYKTLEELARKNEELEKAELLRQQQREITRYLLKTLTSQLESSTQSYRVYKTAEKDGQEVKKLIVPVLENIIGVLSDLKGLYENVQEDKERTKQVVERIDKTLENYQRELKFYSERE